MKSKIKLLSESEAYKVMMADANKVANIIRSKYPDLVSKIANAKYTNDVVDMVDGLNDAEIGRVSDKSLHSGQSWMYLCGCVANLFNGKG